MDNKIWNDETNDTNRGPKKDPHDPRKHPRPGYDEKNPTKKDIQDHPEDPEKNSRER